MNRVRGNQEFLDGLSKQLEGGVTEVGLSIQFQIYSVLIDISKSLAVIADNTDDIGKNPITKIVEEVRKEEKNGESQQGSEV